MKTSTTKQLTSPTGMVTVEWIFEAWMSNNPEEASTALQALPPEERKLIFR